MIGGLEYINGSRAMLKDVASVNSLKLIEQDLPSFIQLTDQYPSNYLLSVQWTLSLVSQHQKDLIVFYSLLTMDSLKELY